MADKARYYLEQYVPELREYERKEIFTPEEIRSIASKRGDFEHIINARGSKPGDYARYATYEMNLDSLRKKRCKRLGVKSTTYTGQRTIFFILDRATQKFPGDMGLWMQYINFCQKEKANKKLTKVFTNVLRLKPREWGLWVLAAKYYVEAQGDMSAARSYMQRGLRFCKDERRLWLEYLRLEMVYLAKLAARRRILGLDDEGEKEEERTAGNEEAVTAEDIDPNQQKGVEEVDDDALKKLAAAPAFTGAIPIAIFDSAMKQFKNDPECAEAAFDLCAEFDKVPSTKRILRHILRNVNSTSQPGSTQGTVISTSLEAKLLLSGVAPESEDFPAAFGSALSYVRKAQQAAAPEALPLLAEKVVLFLLPYLRQREELDEDVVTVLEASVRFYMRHLAQLESAVARRTKALSLPGVLASLRKDGREADADILEWLSGSADGP